MAVRQSTDGGDDLDQAVENFVLAVDVVVQRGRLDAQLAGEPAHRDRFQPLVVRNDQRDLQSPSQVQRRPVGDRARPTAHGSRLSCWFLVHWPTRHCRRAALDNLTPLE